ncbi:unnamed protein product [Rotaria sordida]|uniref:Reelin domain-containing protein n=1 Tax=Rotaria sordida TaxID=392033 RepID=A0A815TSA7_9BILA|nr:unnamed protein product [Rotaria sordida]
MLPRHGVSSQQCSSKYLIEPDKLQYHISDTVRITVRGSTNDDTFKGLLLVAKTKTNQQIIGTWSVVGSDIKTLNCGGIDNTGITHNSPSDKSSIEALWHPPSTIIEDSIVIKATIVQSFDKIYVDCFSITLTAKPTDTTTTVASTTSLTSTVTGNYINTITNTSHHTTTSKASRSTTTSNTHHSTTTPNTHHSTTTSNTHLSTITQNTHHSTATSSTYLSTITSSTHHSTTTPSTYLSTATPKAGGLALRQTIVVLVGYS